MTYYVIASGLGLIGSVALALWFRHKAGDLRKDLALARKAHASTLTDLGAEVEYHNETKSRLEAVIRGKDVEFTRLENRWYDHLQKCPDPALVGEFVRSKLSLPKTADSTHPAEYVPDPESTPGGKRSGGGSS